ncbi:metallo-beta-lactamase family protein [Phlyctema vagabunda]|uniref:Metallo-beta-lactamase family protein n=1 Tax=Phlyctema vagabunda TaxID=108571 RepID=A0ABR4PS54_9HELO
MKFRTASVAVGLLATSANAASSHQTFKVPKEPLRVETFINPGPSLDMVSSLIIGSEAAVLIDMPLAIPQAKNLASWIKNTTDKPLVSVFTTHFHPDHYLSGAAVLEEFPDTKYYANSHAVAHIEVEAVRKVAQWKDTLGNDAIVDTVAIPTPHDFTFFTLPGDEDTPVELLSPPGGNTIDETFFWIPSIKTVIAGDSVYSHQMHMWLADLLTPELTESWLTTIEFISYLEPSLIIPGHALDNTIFGSAVDLEHTYSYVKYFKDNIESKGINSFTPQEISNMLNSTFPGLAETTTSATLLNITAEEFGRGGSRQPRFTDLHVYNNLQVLDGWIL